MFWIYYILNRIWHIYQRFRRCFKGIDRIQKNTNISPHLPYHFLLLFMFSFWYHQQLRLLLPFFLLMRWDNCHTKYFSRVFRNETFWRNTVLRGKTLNFYFQEENCFRFFPILIRRILSKDQCLLLVVNLE